MTAVLTADRPTAHRPTAHQATAHQPTASRRKHRASWLVLALALLAFAIFEVVEHHLGPWPILAFIMSPDLSFFAGLGATAAKGQLPPRAVPIYNFVHRPWIPLLLVALAPSGVLGMFWFVAGLSWLTHIALDHAAGYRLRTKDGWQRD